MCSQRPKSSVVYFCCHAYEVKTDFPRAASVDAAVIPFGGPAVGAALVPATPTEFDNPDVLELSSTCCSQLFVSFAEKALSVKMISQLSVYARLPITGNPSEQPCARKNRRVPVEPVSVTSGRLLLPCTLISALVE